ncbi:MAG: hypothetical protein R3E96_02415 [Planctomycetota bacterium]
MLRAKLGPDWEDNELKGYAEGFDELAWRKRCQETLEKRIEARAEEVTGLLHGQRRKATSGRSGCAGPSRKINSLGSRHGAHRARPRWNQELPLAARAPEPCYCRPSPDSRPLRKLLAQSAKKRLWDRDMPGGAWYEDDFGCFPDPVFNEKLAVGIDCGTGGVPPVSRRLLRYYRPE